MAGNFCRLLLLAVLLSACGSTRKCTETEARQFRTDSAGEELKAFQTNNVDLTDLVRTDLDIRIDFVRYDTDKPTNPETGLPPVKETGQVTVDVGRQRDIAVHQRDTSVVEREKTAESVQEDDGRMSVRKEHEETTLPRQWACELVKT